MVEAETVCEVTGAANGTCPPEDTVEAVIEKEDQDKNGVQEMEEDRKSEALKADTDHELMKGNKSKKEEKEVEAVKIEEENDFKEEECENDEEQADERKEEKVKAEESEEEKGSKKRKRGKSFEGLEDGRKKEVGVKKGNEPVTPVALSIDRPVRERKSVERLVISIEKEQAKEFLVEKGRGTALKYIPNVAYKLSRKKTDETIKMLHMILFGRRGKAFQVKSNLSQFSGFVWHENEEKQKLKIKEKFDKCIKEKLLGFCDLLDIHVAKIATRKEDIVTKLLDFLVAPHATTDVLCAEKEQSSKAKKRKRAIKGSVSSSGGTTTKSTARKRRKTNDAPKGKITPDMEDESQEDEDDENENGVSDGSDDEVAEHLESEDKKDDSEEETEKHKQGSRKSLSKKESSGKTKTRKLTTPKKAIPVTSPKKPPTKSSPKHSKNDDNSDTSPKVFSRKKKNEEAAKNDDNSDTSPKVFSRKKKNEEAAKRKSSTPSKSAKEKDSKEKIGKKVAKGKDRRKVEPGPSEDELRKAIVEILKEVDFNTATFTDMIKQLASHFNMDLSPRKSAIKLIIQEELTKLAEEAGENEDEEDDEGEKEEGQEPDAEEVGTSLH